MNIRLSYILIILLFAACKGKQAGTSSDSLSFDTASIPSKPDMVGNARQHVDDFVVVYTGCYDFEVGSGRFAIVKAGNTLIDTIDRGFGIQKLKNGGVLYQTIKSYRGDSDELPSCGDGKAIYAMPGNYTMLKNKEKKVFNTMVSGFDDYFSSPAVLNGNIYFWQIRKLQSGNNSISAAAFDPVSEMVKTQYLFNDYIETDASTYFDPPYVQDKLLVFLFDGKTSKFSSDFKLIK